MPRKKKTLVVNKLDGMQRMHYYLDYDYDSEYSDPDCDHYYCSCSVITNMRVKGVYLDSLRDAIVENGTTELNYAVDRLLRIHRLYDPTIWELSASPSYYGEEIDSGWVEDVRIVQAFDRDLAAFRKYKTLTKQIEFLLIKEYGYLLDALDGCKYTLEKLAMHEIHLGQRDHYSKLDQRVVQDYTDHKLPLGVVLANDDAGYDAYRVIDGYHRIAAAQQAGKRKLEVFVAR